MHLSPTPSVRAECKFACAILLSKRGDIVLQHRDDVPYITNPNLYGLFGGHIEDGESPDEAVVREIEEETGITAGLTFLSFVQQPVGIVAIYTATVDLDELILGEGQGFRVIPSALFNVDDYSVEPMARAVVAEFIQANT